MTEDLTIEKLTGLLKHHLVDVGFLDSATLFDVGTTIGMVTSHFLQEKDGWKDTDLIMGIKYGFSWKTGKDENEYESSKKYNELLKRNKELQKEMEEEVDKLSHLIKSQNLIFITKNDDPKTYQNESEFRDIDNAPDRYTTR